MQPLVENAVVHGMAGHQGMVTVHISVALDEEVLTIRVVNTIAEDRISGNAGIGIKNVRERIAVQFEGRASLITSQVGTEWRSELSLPAVQAAPAVSREAAPAEKYRPSKLVST